MGTYIQWEGFKTPEDASPIVLEEDGGAWFKPKWYKAGTMKAEGKPADPRAEMIAEEEENADKEKKKEVPELKGFAKHFLM